MTSRSRSGAGIMEDDDRQVTTVFDSPTIIPPSALDKPSIMKRYHRRRTCSHTSPRRSPTMVTLHDTQFVECRWWNDGWTVKTVVTWRSSASMIPAPGNYGRQPLLLFIWFSFVRKKQTCMTDYKRQKEKNSYSDYITFVSGMPSGPCVDLEITVPVGWALNTNN